jgi:hypothetical protein
MGSDTANIYAITAKQPMRTAIDKISNFRAPASGTDSTKAESAQIKEIASIDTAGTRKVVVGIESKISCGGVRMMIPAANRRAEDRIQIRNRLIGWPIGLTGRHSIARL